MEQIAKVLFTIVSWTVFQVWIMSTIAESVPPKLLLPSWATAAMVELLVVWKLLVTDRSCTRKITEASTESVVSAVFVLSAVTAVVAASVVIVTGASSEDTDVVTKMQGVALLMVAFSVFILWFALQRRIKENENG